MQCAPHHWFCLILLFAAVCNAQHPASSPGGSPGTTPSASPAAPQDSPYRPPLAAASDEGQRALAGMQLEAGWKAALWAAEPLLGNPVVFSVENPASILVCETWRQADKGVPDNRDHPQWLNDDLAAQTVADREAYYVKHYPAVAKTWATHHDRLVRVEDRDGDGIADHSGVFADGFNNLADGTGSGVLNLNGSVYYTCIPDLWMLRDEDGDGHAEVKRSFGRGFGVRTALRGHDMHGLVLGPDGRIYWSIGDRGYNLTTLEYGQRNDPGSGAVFRCFPDGSGMEVVCTGLRNPQELAFDDHFNLFTCDNNSDHEDRARIVQIVEGGETGWRMNFQTLGDRGPWVAEGWWKPRFADQAAFLIPTIATMGSGPSGFACAPGTGMPEKYRGAFLLADFLGGRSHSGIRAFKLAAAGATFKLQEDWHLVKGVLATDVEFGPDGAVWISDWVDGWVGEGKGRIYRLKPEGDALAAEARDTRTLLARDLSTASTSELCLLIAHADRRIRLAAHSALAARRAQDELFDIAMNHANPLARIHGVFGLWQIGLKRGTITAQLLPLLTHTDPEVRAQAARVTGDITRKGELCSQLRAPLRELLHDASPRVQFYAAIALGRLRDHEAVPALLAMAERNNDADPLLRHAARMGLAGCADERALVRLRAHASVAVRRCAVLALRRNHSAALGRWLADADASIRLEAARAIYDLPVFEAFPALAAQLNNEESQRTVPRLLLRAVAAAAQLGRQQDLQGLADIAANNAANIDVRKAALDELVSWDAPFFRERVLNEVRARVGRVSGAAETLLVNNALPVCIAATDDALARAAAEAAATHWHDSLVQPLTLLANSKQHAALTRLAALKALAAHQAITPATLAAFLQEQAPQLRSGAAALLARTNPEQALPLLDQALHSQDAAEAQAAVAGIASIASAEAAALIAAALQRVRDGSFVAGATLDVLEAASARDATLQQQAQAIDAVFTARGGIGLHTPCLEGGDVAAGKKLFLEKSEVSCTRCHLVKGAMPEGGFRAGPELTHIATQRSKAEILLSILTPNAVLTEGWVSVNLETRDDGVISGRLLKEDAEGYELEIGDTGTPEHRRVLKETVLSRYGDGSAMPGDVASKLTRRELRDLVAFLASLR